MWTHSECASAVLLGCLGTIVMLASCSGDAPTGVEEDRVSADRVSEGRISVCHRSRSTGVITDISQSALTSHLRHGDYVTNLVVSHESDQPDDGAHFRRIGDALAAARAGRLARGELRAGRVPHHDHHRRREISGHRPRQHPIGASSTFRWWWTCRTSHSVAHWSCVWMPVDALPAAGVGPFATTLVAGRAALVPGRHLDADHHRQRPSRRVRGQRPQG